MLQTLIKQNTFVVYNEFDKSYKIRNLLQEFFYAAGQIPEY